jgi:hypothetical protein
MDRAGVYGGVIIGKTSNTEPSLDQSMPHGIITPRTEDFVIKGTKFYNYNWNDAAALGTCSHCFHPAATDNGARTAATEKLVFDSSVTRRIRYQYPYRAIFHDRDGSLTDKGPNTWATYWYEHLDQSECQRDETKFNGIVCDSSVQIRRIGLRPGPSGLFAG